VSPNRLSPAAPFLLFIAALLPLASGAGQQGGGGAGNGLARTPPPTRQEAPGEGVLCGLAIAEMVAETGRRCFPGQDAAVQAELARSEARIEDYVLRNSRIDRAALDRFRRHQLRSVGRPSFCRGDVAGIYRSAVGEGVARLRAGTDILLARPGPPSWGDCI
jgi:hypothetical protein